MKWKEDLIIKVLVFSLLAIFLVSCRVTKKNEIKENENMVLFENTGRFGNFKMGFKEGWSKEFGQHGYAIRKGTSLVLADFTAGDDLYKDLLFETCRENLNYWDLERFSYDISFNIDEKVENESSLYYKGTLESKQNYHFIIEARKSECMYFILIVDSDKDVVEKIYEEEIQ